MRIVFTGASGHLGRRFLDLFPNTTPCSIRYGNNEQFIGLSKALEGADVLIHAAANLAPKDIDTAFKDNVILPFDIINMAGKVNPNAHIILISSMSLLGEDCQPKKLREMTVYAASKYIMEELAFSIAKNPLTIVRFSSLFYFDQAKDGLSKMVYTSWKNKSVVASDCRRDFLPIWVACKWLYKLCGNKAWYNRTINLASGTSINMMDIAKYLVEKYGVACHSTPLPDYTDICYKFSPDDPQSLERIPFDIYRLIDEYYEKLKGK